MKIYLKLLVFFLCNTIGFFIGSFLYAMAQIYKFIDIENSGFSLASMQYDMGVIMIIWLACAIFSFASFFLSKKWKIFFLSMPIAMPFITSLILLSNYM